MVAAHVHACDGDSHIGGSIADIAKAENAKLSDEEIELGTDLIERMSDEFEPDKYRDVEEQNITLEPRYAEGNHLVMYRLSETDRMMRLTKIVSPVTMRIECGGDTRTYNPRSVSNC